MWAGAIGLAAGGNAWWWFTGSDISWWLGPGAALPLLWLTNSWRGKNGQAEATEHFPTEGPLDTALGRSAYRSANSRQRRRVTRNAPAGATKNATRKIHTCVV